MNRKKSMERKLACETIHNVSVSKVGQAISKKNPHETRVLVDKLEGLEIHKRRWKNEVCGRVYDAREEFRQTRIVSFVRSTSGSNGTKTSIKTNFIQPRRASTTRKTNVRTKLYQRPNKEPEIGATSHRDPSQNTVKTEKDPKTTLKKKTLATDIKIYLNDKLINATNESEKTTEVKKERDRGSITPDCMTPFIRHSFVDCPNRTNRTASADVNQCEKKCQTCALVLAKTHLDIPQKEGSNHFAVREISDSYKKEFNHSKAPPQENAHSRSRISIKKFSDSALTRPCCVPSPSNPSEALKHAHIWKARVDDIVCKRRAVSGFLKREKVNNLLRKSSKMSGQSLLPSPVKDARFLGLQSLLVPATKNTEAYNRQVVQSIERP